MKKPVIAAALLLPLALPVMAATDLDAAAADVCKCLEEPYGQAQRVLELVQQAMASGNSDQLVASQNDMVAVVETARQCFEGVAARHPEIEQSDPLKVEVMTRVDKLCPNPALELPTTY
jgi:hypothetical protein